MGLIMTNFDPPFKPGEQFDFLGRKAAEVLSDLFLGVQVILNYKRGRVISNIQSAQTFEKGSSPGHLRTRFMSVPDDRRWKRQICVMPSEAVSYFLALHSQESSDDHRSRQHSVPNRRKVQRVSPRWVHPQELVTAVSICEHALRTWAKFTGPDLHPQIRMPLSVEFPRWLISHVIASLYYSSEASASDNQMRDVLAKTVSGVHRYLESLASHRVEAKEVSHGIIIASPPKAPRSWKIGKYPDDFQTLKRTPLLADGLRAALWISPSGEAVGWLTAKSLRKTKLRADYAAGPFGSLGFPAEASALLRGLSLALRKNGSIVIFAKGHPLFIWRSGKWRGLLWHSLQKVIKKQYGAIGATMLDAAVILSTMGQSGVLGLVEEVPEGLHEKDRVDIARRRIRQLGMHGGREKVPQVPTPASQKGINDIYPEWLFHALLHSDKVISLGPSMLAMLASIDGVTLINRKGRLLAYGAIISSRPRGSEGARSAAALELSNKGFVIKVSADGPISLYEGGREIAET
jgi:hypothetical protein